jgi:hypothetical protein
MIVEGKLALKQRRPTKAGDFISLTVDFPELPPPVSPPKQSAKKAKALEAGLSSVSKAFGEWWARQGSNL